MDARYTMSEAIMQDPNIFGRKSAWFHETIFGVERINGLCMDMGIFPHVYHSGVNAIPEDTFITYPELNNPAFKARLQTWASDGTRELKRWMRSSSDALITCKSLKEGFDQPDMRVLVMVSGTNEVRSRVQTIGRPPWSWSRTFHVRRPTARATCIASQCLEKDRHPQREVHHHVGGGLNPAHLSQSTGQTEQGSE